MTTLPGNPATPPNETAQSDALKASIDALLPTLWKEDTSSQLTGMLKIIAQARFMGADGFKQLKTFAKTLRNTRAFDDLYLLTSEMNAGGMADNETKRWEVQALIELKVFETALDLVRPMLGLGVQEFDGREAYGHLGRIYKQMYVDAVKSSTPTEEPATLKLYLERSFAAYMHVWDKLKNEETAYHGINAVAVAYRALKDKFTTDDPEAPKLAQQVLDVVAAPGVTDVWAKGTQGEALIALGRHEEAAAAYAAYAAHPHVSVFALNASLRQLEEVWGLNGEDAKEGLCVRLLKTALIGKAHVSMSADAPAPVQLHGVNVKLSKKEAELLKHDLGPEPVAGETGASAHALQKVLGKAMPTGARLMRKALRRADAVCRIHGQQDGFEKPFASGFAVKGGVLNDAWAGRTVIVTNNHVISSGAGGATRFELCKAVFVSPEDEPDVRVEFDGILWESAIGAHDVTILSIKGELPASVTPLDQLRPIGLDKRLWERKVADAPGTEGPDNEPEGIGKCYVIGYPEAGELCVSLDDNILLDHDAPPTCDVRQDGPKRVYKDVPAQPVRLHYRTPTVPGSSGSPVFDSENFALVGVHHAGSQSMQRLKPYTGTYAANEGIWIDSIREAIAESLSPERATESAGITPQWAAGAAPPMAPRPAPTPEIMGADLSRKEHATTTVAEASFAGSPGDPMPGVSSVAEQVLHAPGKASEEDIRNAGLESIVGPDSRIRIFDTRMTPWRMICAIRSRWGSKLAVGTGCFIGPNTILTAGHVVFPKQPGVLPDDIEIIPGLNVADVPYGSVKALKVSVHPQWSGAFEIQHDVAVIHLAEPLGQRVGWFGVAVRGADELKDEWAHVTGYPGEKFERPPAIPGGQEQAPVQAAQMWHHSAPITDARNGRIFYSVDTTPGQSGAPIYVLPDAKTRATPMVIGVHAYGVQTSPGGKSNSGAWIDDALFAEIGKWRAESDRLLSLKRT